MSYTEGKKRKVFLRRLTMFLIEGAVMTADGLEWLAETSALSKKI